MPKPSFRFKQFTIQQDRCALKVGTDGVLFGAWVNYTDAERILDIGTGTGVLALIAAQRNATASVDAVEIDDAAAEQAAENAAASPWSDRVRVHRMDVRRMTASERFDLIICNPPYYAGYSTAADERVGLAKHSDELQFDELLDAVDRLLAPAGRFAVIIPLNRERAFLQEAERMRLFPARRCVVKYVSHRPAKRLLLELDRAGGAVREEELTIERTGPFDYTPEYRALISDLMLNF
ncbi:MAG TPA: methyltransferase [Flavobacteriales bacterium]|nr:methyltransferase [Flavobacteriales bacterium]HNU55972.1 methyltransferase [Flavobacteriales bacterium]